MRKNGETDEHSMRSGSIRVVHFSHISHISHKVSLHRWRYIVGATSFRRLITSNFAGEPFHCSFSLEKSEVPVDSRSCLPAAMLILAFRDVCSSYHRGI